MTLRNTFRSFAIYLAATLIISESPVSAFTIQRTKTTTLKSSYDLIDDASVLLEVKHDLPKVNNAKGNTTIKDSIRTQIGTVTPTRTFPYTREGNKISPVATSANKLPNEKGNTTTKDSIRTQIGTVTPTRTFPYTREGNKISPVATSANKLPNEKGNTTTKDSIRTQIGTVTPTRTFPYTREGNKISPVATSANKLPNEKGNTTIKDSLRTQIGTTSPTRIFPYTREVNKTSTVATTTNKLEVENKYRETTFDFTKLDTIQSTTDYEKGVEVTSEIGNLAPKKVSTLPPEENTNQTSIDDIITDANYTLSTTTFEEKKNDERLLVTEGLSQSNTTNDLQIHDYSQSTTIYNESSTSLPDTSLTETMIGEASSSVTKDPSWKTYTTIDRKRLLKTTEFETPSTLESEELATSETVTSQVTVDNDANDTPILSLEELRQELLYNSKTPKPLSEATRFSPTPSTDPTTSSNYVTGIETSSSISITNTEPSTVANNFDFVSSKRAGFLDLNDKKNDPVAFSTVESLNSNDTELIDALFEIDAAESEASAKKPSTPSESLRQLANDAINEELLEEQVLNDNLMKPYGEGVRLGKSNGSNDELITEDVLIVKPITTKGALYTVSPNYKPMKKIEVQPLKPFVRDPDDNSWRNESLSLLGIVFNANNASKPFTQVLKNKTEAELNNISDKTDKNEVTDLRERLNKITEVRKSLKKKINKFGDTVYGDYEESTSSETTSMPKVTYAVPLFDENGKLAFVDRTPAPATSARPNATTTPGVYMYKEETVTTKKPKKLNKFSEYYDTTDEYDADYISLSKIDLKKFTTRLFGQEPAATPPTVLTTQTKPSNIYLPDRKPTVQYFPPRPKVPKVSMNDYDNNFQKKLDLYTFTEPPQRLSQISRGTTLTTPPRYATPSPDLEPPKLDKTLYATFPSRIDESSNRYTTGNDESFNRASYVIKHYKDLINAAAKDDYDKNGDYMSTYTETPLSGVTINEMGKVRSSMDDDYDYMSHKDILNKFVDNFNQNSERFKVDFPILYNNSVVHSQGGKAAASSMAYLKRAEGRACPSCDLKVELSPAYELHYYVPEQEEREQAEPKPATLSYAYRL